MARFETPLDWKSEVWWRKRPVEERLWHMHIPPRIRGDLRDDQAWTPGRNLLLHGPAGTGKSRRAADYLTNAVREHDLSGRWIAADDYIEMIKDSFGSDDGLLPDMYHSPYMVKNIKGVFDVVVIDGLGEERLTDFAAHELAGLIRRRFNHMKSTIVTSTLTLDDIKNRYSERLASALADFDMESTSRGRQ